MGLAAGVGLLAALGAASPAQAQPTDQLSVPAERYQLANGLEVILHQDRSLPVVYVNVTYHVGSGNERPGQSGYAHLFEHLMFQGTRHVGIDQHFSILRGIGARDVNGSTNTDRTNYFQSVPAHELETALWLESDRMGYLLLEQQALDNQREVVRNERRANYENVAFKDEFFAVAQALYPEGHPYRYLTIGLHEDLQRATLDDARAFFARWYVPANATLLLAGDFDGPAARALIDKWFGTFPASTRPKVTVPPPPKLTRKQRVQFTDPLATTPRVRYVWPSPAYFAEGDAELDLIAHMLASTTGSLRHALTYQKSLARAVSAGQSSRGFSGEFHVVVDLVPGADLDDVETILVNTVRSFASGGNLGERELAQAVAAREVGTMRALESVSSRGSYLQTFGHYGLPPDSLEWNRQRYRKVRIADIRATAGRVFNGARVEVITLPASKPAATASRRRVPEISAAAATARSLEAAWPLEATQEGRGRWIPPAAPARATTTRGGN